jgi:hypothetical protein
VRPAAACHLLLMLPLVEALGKRDAQVELSFSPGAWSTAAASVVRWSDMRSARSHGSVCSVWQPVPCQMSYPPVSDVMYWICGHDLSGTGTL